MNLKISNELRKIFSNSFNDIVKTEEFNYILNDFNLLLEIWKILINNNFDNFRIINDKIEIEENIKIKGDALHLIIDNLKDNISDNLEKFNEILECEIELFDKENIGTNGVIFNYSNIDKNYKCVFIDDKIFIELIKRHKEKYLKALQRYYIKFPFNVGKFLVHYVLNIGLIDVEELFKHYLDEYSYIGFLNLNEELLNIIKENDLISYNFISNMAFKLKADIFDEKIKNEILDIIFSKPAYENLIADLI
jgi:hypothetical protein